MPNVFAKDDYGLTLIDFFLLVCSAIKVFVSPTSLAFKVLFSIFTVINIVLIAISPFKVINNFKEHPCTFGKASLLHWTLPIILLSYSGFSAQAYLCASTPGLIKAMSIGFAYVDFGLSAVYAGSWVIKLYNSKATYQPLPPSK